MSEQGRLEIDKLLSEMNLSDETESLVKKCLEYGGSDIFCYNPKTGFLGYLPSDENDNSDDYKRKMLEIIEKAPIIKNFHTCYGVVSRFSSYKNRKEIEEAVRNKFPNSYIGCRW